MTASRAAATALALLVAAPAKASGPQHRETISLESAYDSNARRVDDGPLVTPDVLAQAFATGRLWWRGRTTAFSLSLELGGKHFARVKAEDVAVGRLGVSVSHALGRTVLGLDADYKDAFQRGDRLARLPPDSPLSCAPPEGASAQTYRCNRRDLREAALAGRITVPLGRRLGLEVRAGASLFQYKPNPVFTYLGPQGALVLRWRASRHHTFALTAAAALRAYASASTTFEPVPTGTGTRLEPTGIPRVEQVYTGGLTWAYRGPLLVTASLTVARSVNNGAGMDVWRARLEVNAAAFLGPRTTGVVTAAFQAALWPDGDVYRNLTPIGDQSEQENALGLKIAQRLTGHLQAVVKIEAFANEISAQARPFSRLVIQSGLELDL